MLGKENFDYLCREDKAKTNTNIHLIIYIIIL